MMEHTDALNILQDRSNLLKSKLVHEQLGCGNYTFGYFEKYSSLILNDYKRTKSLCISALNMGINYSDVLTWYIQGKLGDSHFKQFYLVIDRINMEPAPKENISISAEEIVDEAPKETLVDGEYVISQYGDGWSYKTFVDCEKVFLISDDLKRLKEKVKAKGLPLDNPKF